ncbi:MAG TPA: YdeI/OmpD-associated family protein [Polyangiaceae bacterium]|nr:YdeI/OmpD-associated family protein [Polyangiaceae bacterium]
MAEPKHVRAKSRDEWRSWLEKNHSSAESVIVVYARKGSGKPSVTYDESVEEALCYGWIDGVRGKLDETHFTVRFTPRKAKSIWSKINLERVAQLTKSGKMHASGKAAFELGKSSGRHAKAYAIRDAVAMPSELRAALAGDRKGRAAFEALSPGQKKGWMRSVSWGTQNEATRKQRARDALLLILAGRKSGETDAQAARRGIASKAKILGRS